MKTNFFAEELKRLIKASERTQKDIAKDLGISHVTLIRWSKGEKVSIDDVIRISQYFQVPINKFFAQELIECSDLESANKIAALEKEIDNYKQLCRDKDRVIETQEKIIKMLESEKLKKV